MVNIRVWRLNEAANEYDSRLIVGRDERSGYWTVYMKNGPTKPPHPVLALARDEADLPDPEGLKRKLYQMDTVRHGAKILDDINRHNAEIEARERRASDEATELAAEAMAWGTYRMTNDIGRKRVSVKMNEKAKNRLRITS